MKERGGGGWFKRSGDWGRVVKTRGPGVAAFNGTARREGERNS